MSVDHIRLPEERKREQHCSISISESDIWIRWDPPLPEGPHKVTRAEVMAAGALIGVARTLSGKGADEVISSLVKFDRAARKTR